MNALQRFDSMYKGKPRVIRRVIRWSSAKGPGGKRYPKRVRDIKLHADLERVVARTARPCHCKKCHSLIRSGTTYFKVHANEGRGRYVRGRMIYSPHDYHERCVPEQYRPMLRFFKDRP